MGGPVVVEAAATWVVLRLAAVRRAKVPLAGEAGDVAELLHPVGDGQEWLTCHIRTFGVGAWHAALPLARVAGIVREAELVLDAPGHQPGA